jgi:hypothetical protein
LARGTHEALPDARNEDILVYVNGEFYRRDEAKISWPAGPKPEDGVWAKHWYRNVHASTGFEPYEPRKDPFPTRIKPLLEECQPLYERLRDYAIGA